MKHFIFIFIAVCSFSSLSAQEILQEQLKDSVDVNYREDQYYLALTYNLLSNRPSDVSQNGFSPGIHVGVIRDIPLNQNRNFGLGIGLGYSGNVINENLVITKSGNNSFGFAIGEDDFIRNNIVYHAVEVPIEIRWRTSSPTDYAFWRIYTGLKVGYVFAARSRLQSTSGDVKTKIADAMNRWQYGLTLSVGNDKINAHLYYGLNAIFNSDQQLNGQTIDINTLKIGLILYIL